MLDIVIAGGTVVDGSGGPGFSADVGIERGLITRIGSLSKQPCRLRLDASGLIVSPGFIDIHTHSDLACLSDRLADSKVRQGVTTELVGLCGWSVAPVFGAVAEELAGELRRWNLEADWTTVDEYLAAVDRRGTAVNIGTLVGHGTVRTAVVGTGAVEPGNRLAAMTRAVDHALSNGAFGLSLGLYYAPGCYAGPEEIVALLGPIRKHRRFAAVHLRSEAGGLDRALDEVVTASRSAGSRLHISHLKAAGRPNHGRMDSIISRLESTGTPDAVTCDVYPYQAGHTSLGSLLPPWALAGGEQGVRNRLRQPECRDRVVRDLSRDSDEWENMGLMVGWDNIVIGRTVNDRRSDLVGRDLAAIASSLNQTPEQCLCELIADGESEASIIKFMMDPADVNRALAWHRAAIASDAAAATPGGPGAAGRPHPRASGTFPRVLGTMRREGLVTLAEAVRKMTGLPAAIAGIDDRGRLAPGMRADVTIFNPDTVSDRATYEQPLLPPTGIVHVIVNGEPVLLFCEPTGSLPGAALRAREGGDTWPR